MNPQMLMLHAHLCYSVKEKIPGLLSTRGLHSTIAYDISKPMQFCLTCDKRIHLLVSRALLISKRVEIIPIHQQCGNPPF